MTTDTINRVPVDIDHGENDPPRWIANITFRTEAGPVTDTQFFEEMEELHNIIEEGPNFYAIESVTLTINPLRRIRHYSDTPTLEQCAKE